MEELRRAVEADVPALNALMHASRAYDGDYRAMLDGYFVTPAQVARDLVVLAERGGEVGLVACAVRCTQALKLQVALGMRKQYLDLVPVFARPEILRRASEIACDVACALVEAADNFSHWLARAALFLQRARPTVLLAGAIATLAILVDAAKGRLIIAVELARRLAARTCQRVRCRVVCKHRPAECTSSFALLPERDVWRDADHPGQQFRCAIRLSKARC